MEYDPEALGTAFAKYPDVKAVLVLTCTDFRQIWTKYELCRKHNVPLIEDAAESLGTRYKEVHGTFGDYGVFLQETR